MYKDWTNILLMVRSTGSCAVLLELFSQHSEGCTVEVKEHKLEGCKHIHSRTGFSAFHYTVRARANVLHDVKTSKLCFLCIYTSSFCKSESCTHVTYMFLTQVGM